MNEDNHPVGRPIMTPPINIEGYRRERGPEWCAIFDTMRDYRLSNMVFDGTEEPYCLVDAVSNEGGSVESGEEQLLMLADEISLALAARRAANTPVARIVTEDDGVSEKHSWSASPALPSQVVEGFDATKRTDQIAMAIATLDGEQWVRLSDHKAAIQSCLTSPAAEPVDVTGEEV